MEAAVSAMQVLVLHCASAFVVDHLVMDVTFAGKFRVLAMLVYQGNINTDQHDCAAVLVAPWLDRRTLQLSK